MALPARRDRPPRCARFYGYSVAGPIPQGRYEWHCFDPDKILLDPYAKSIFFPSSFDRAAASRPGSNAGKAPLGVLFGAGDAFDWGEDQRPRHQSNTIIYELHVRGFTNNPNSGVDPQRRGTFAGLVEKIPYLKDLGVTALELMPIFQFDPQEGNYWGYMPLNFFTPHHSYGSRADDFDQHNEFRIMVKALHAADIEVILDVVYNHTGEGDQRARSTATRESTTVPIICVRPAGEPLREFLRHREHSALFQPLRPQDDRGQPALLGHGDARRWLSVRPGLGVPRNDDGSLNLNGASYLGDIPPLPNWQDPFDRRAVGRRGGVQLGLVFPAGMGQWNGRYRDDIRRFVRGDPGLVPA